MLWPTVAGEGEYDAICVGAGINGLVAAAALARAGWRVCVLERGDTLGGAIRTADLTVPGYHHDVFSGWHPLFTGSPAYASLATDLGARGLTYLNTEHPTATVQPDGTSSHLATDRRANLAEFAARAPEDGDAWSAGAEELLGDADLTLGILGTELWSRRGLALARRAWRRKGSAGTLAFGGDLLQTARTWLTQRFRSPGIHALLAPWVLHAGVGPDDATSGYLLRVIAAALEMGGMPVPQGGGARLVDALAGLITDHGGDLEVGTDVERVVVEGGRATGVRLASGAKVRARRAVLCSVTPAQLYLRLLDRAHVPPELRVRAERFRQGRACMVVHLALSEPPRWQGDERLARTAVVHLTSGLDGTARAVAEAERGLLPAEATIVCGQPMAVDPSRGPEGGWILWLQLQELPARPQGDAAGELDVSNGWTEALREAYADRVQRRVAAHVPNLEGALRGRAVLSPADLERANRNLVGGDPYGGACTVDQSFLWRPLPGRPGHTTPVRGLYHIGASTHPGPGLGAGSGWLVSQELLRPGLPGRVRGALRLERSPR
ncbi:MAG: NAD(P)/FAD-dependent oxidoreductase [bacterium]|jgi:phytoene dehydrogenase-like protein|nr:NAD(P)/FAD-dependent oxidoreductase [bacterium]